MFKLRFIFQRLLRRCFFMICISVPRLCRFARLGDQFGVRSSCDGFPILFSHLRYCTGQQGTTCFIPRIGEIIFEFRVKMARTRIKEQINVYRFQQPVWIACAVFPNWIRLWWIYLMFESVFIRFRAICDLLITSKRWTFLRCESCSEVKGGDNHEVRAFQRLWSCHPRVIAGSGVYNPGWPHNFDAYSDKR